jgi:hypothetical protein
MAVTVETSLAISLLMMEAQTAENQDQRVKHIWSAFENLRLASGTGTGQADLCFSDQRALGTSSNEDLDFAGGFTSPLGGAVTMAKAKLIVIYNSGTTILKVKKPAANGLVLFDGSTDAIYVNPGGFMVWYDPAGLTVTAGTGDKLNVANTSGAVVAAYSVYALGTSA